MSVISNSIEMNAAPEEVFRVVSDLVSWPRYLPHYRWIRVLENQADHMLVRMACYRGWIPIDWVSKFSADSKTLKLYFSHQKAWTRGMEVVWHLDAISNAKKTKVTISHNLDPVSKRLGPWAANAIVGHGFIDYVATRTLKHFASHFQKTAQ
jgi:ribosome-associated toxin RatA of RatAB toxin-antitoxin module